MGCGRWNNILKGDVMEGLEIVVLLGLTVLVGAILAPRVRVAAPLLLLIFGLVLGLIPQLRQVELPPETVLLIFLPVMLFWESLTTSLRSIRRDLRGIVLLSTLLVVASALAVAGVAHLLGLPWNTALILGAALAPPDATAVAALGRMLPRRNFMLLKAESLTNDGTALVLYAIAVGATLGGSYTPVDIAGLFARSYVGGRSQASWWRQLPTCSWSGYATRSLSTSPCCSPRWLLSCSPKPVTLPEFWLLLPQG